MGSRPRPIYMRLSSIIVLSHTHTPARTFCKTYQNGRQSAQAAGERGKRKKVFEIEMKQKSAEKRRGKYGRGK